MTSLFSRRTILRLSGGVVVASAAGIGVGLLACNWAPVNTSSAVAPLGRLFAGFSNTFDPLDIGRKVRPLLVNDENLVSKIINHRSLVASLEIGCSAQRADFLREKYREDFADGRIMEIDGWILSEAECLTAGLLALATEQSEAPLVLL